MSNRIFASARIVLAVLMFVGGAVNVVAYYVNPSLFPPLHPVMQAMVSSGYLLVPKLLEVTGAVLLLTRFRALALTLLWPVIMNIAAFHAFLDHRAWINGPILLILASLASWPERHAWAALLAPPRSEDLTLSSASLRALTMERSRA